MNNIEILANAFEFIENNLTNEIKSQDVADACYCSKSVLDKVFRFAGQIPVHEYIVRRRMMLAGRKILSGEKLTLLEVALSLGYSTHESFTRAFKKVWNCTPSEFKERKSYYELFPRLYFDLSGGTNMSERRNVDISEMYDLFVQRKNCYFVCCDIRHLIPINEIAYKAGDLAIIEAMERMCREAGEEDIVFRIGADEFVMLTNSEEADYAEDICNRILKYNGQCFKYGEKEIPLELYVTYTKFEGNVMGYKVLYEQLSDRLTKAKY